MPNHSPTLDTSKSPTLGNLNSYTSVTPPTNGSTAGATRVSSLINSGGLLANFADTDYGNRPGIAITGVKSGAGLYYSLDAGAHWNDVGAVSGLSARVLYADANTWVYYAPAANSPSGSVTDAITFKAWDQSGGYSNGQAAVNTVGGFTSSLLGTYDTPGSAADVAISGNYAYLADYSGGLRVFDISSATPKLVATVPTGNLSATGGNALGVALKGTYAYVADLNYGLRVVDITTPLKPKMVGTLDTSGYARGVAVNGNYAYVADGGSGLQVIDISKPSAPKLVGTYNTPDNALSVAVSADGNTAYVADSLGGLQIINVTTKASPALLASYTSYTSYASAQDVALSADGRTAYVADTASGLQIIDVTNKAAPTRLGSYNTDSYTQSVTISGNYAYVTDQAKGAHIIDVSTPASPRLVGIYDTPGDAYAIAVTTGSSATTAVVADWYSGLQVINFAPVATPPDAFSSASDTASATLTLKVPPSIDNATYYASAGVLTVNGRGMTPGDVIDVHKLTVNLVSMFPDSGALPSYTLTSANVSASSATSFSVTLNAVDQAALKGILPGNGSMSPSMDMVYNLAAAANWYNGASTADLGTDPYGGGGSMSYYFANSV